MRASHNSETESNVYAARIHETGGKTLRERKFNISIERQLERLYRNSETLDWSFTDFCVHVLEVLAVLQHRKKVKQHIASGQDNRRLT
jgi:hypothetical protein